MGLILLIVLIVLLLGGLPTWPHSRNWGYGRPSGGLGLVLAIVLILLLLPGTGSRREGFHGTGPRARRRARFDRGPPRGRSWRERETRRRNMETLKRPRGRARRP